MLSMGDLKEHMLPYHVPHRGAGARGQAYTGGSTGFTYSATFGGAQLEGEPYTVAPGSEFRWFRSRILGGRTNHYGRITLRFADYDFRPRSTDGLGTDWPITYDDLAPYYDKAETLHRRHRHRREDSQRARRHLPDDSAAPRVHEVLVQKVLRQARHPRDAPAARRSSRGDQRTLRLPLLRPVRPRLHHRFELLVEQRADLPGDEDRQGPDLRQRDGARAPHRRRAAGDGGVLHRQDDPHRAADPLPIRRARRQRLRVGAPAAQLEVVSASREGSRTVPALSAVISPTPSASSLCAFVPALDGLPRYNSDGLAARTSTCRGGSSRSPKALGLPARLPHRDRRRLRHARARLVHRDRRCTKATAGR